TNEAPASPIVVGGLANGTSVSCRVQAINAMGSGALSAASNTVTPATVPGPPQAVTATAGVLNLSLNFQAPANNGGEAVTSYRATCGSQIVSGVMPPLSFGNLPAGMPLSCSVVAINAVGESAAATSNTVTPQGPPGAPVSPVATRGNGEVSVAFLPPANDGGSMITGYLAICGTQTGKGSASPIVVGNLSNGVPVACGVIALNAVGNSELSVLSPEVTPAGPPGAPTLTAANGGDGRIALSFDAPASDNGAAVLGYTASCTPGTHEFGSTQSPLTVSGLSNGIEYRCSVRAVNDAGSSAASNALLATPHAVADLSISNSNDRTFLRGGSTVSYLIEVSNDGAVAVAGARVRDVVEAPLSGASWVCSGQGGGICPAASGSGDIDVLVDLPAGAVVSFLLGATVAATPETPVTNTATVTVPNGIADPNAANDTAVDGPDVVGISRDGFDGAPP
ncbi:MAG TPA: hypothetical protein VM847_21115, partial [Tahibacter sp.]|nr:hypothetical protein [Tahibacter sp.]